MDAETSAGLPLPAHFQFSRSARYQTVWHTLPYVITHVVRKPFRATAEARASMTAVTNPEFHRTVHDLYCDMFLRGYRQSTGYQADPATGLVLVLFAVFIYAFDDEFEERRRQAEPVDVQSIVASPAVWEVWEALGAYVRAAGRGDEVREYIRTDFLGTGFGQYREGIAAAGGGEADLAAVTRLVEFDSGQALSSAYHLIRLFNRQPYHAGCAAEFYNLGMAGKFMDDMADYRQDVQQQSPNLLRALVGEHPGELTAAHDALTAGELLTARWWAEHCPVTCGRYLQRTAGYYTQVQSPALRLPLDVYLALLGSRRFWTISTVRERQRTA